ncbi:potassium transporter 21-like [Carex rostrata]
MVISNGIFTPYISVLSTIYGGKKNDPRLSEDEIAMISMTILMVLFSIQRFGTDKFGYTFVPAILVWYNFIGIIDRSYLLQHDYIVLKAFIPLYILWLQ